jgi:hypothetical protein
VPIAGKSAAASSEVGQARDYDATHDAETWYELESRVVGGRDLRDGPAIDCERTQESEAE